MSWKKLESYVKNSASEEQLPYTNLAPIDNVEKKKNYIDAINYALKDQNVFNIAITGTYGSGKSSILKTYSKNHPSYHYINLSLATFQDDKEKSYNRKLEDKLTIEKSILQQLFYRVKTKRIPYSRFRKIKNIKLIDIIKWIFIILSVVISGILIFFPSTIPKVKSNISVLQDNGFTNTHLMILFVVFVITTFFMLTAFISTLLKRVKLSKIKVQSTELALDRENNEDNDSVFNRYLDEILYFFEVTKYNVVIIEDLDRFEEIEIFTKLRELNTLINNSEQIKRRVVFIYAIKDEIFINKERTKFFDFIIPVLPVINSSNSNEKLFKKIEEAGYENILSKSFINDITVYIDDMRILNNIFNEFIIYLKNHSNITLNSEKLFAMIVYKNIYPKDFARLQFNQGYTSEIFNKKKSLISSLTKELIGKLSEFEAEIKKYEKEHLNSVRELKAAFIYLLRGNNTSIREFNVDNTRHQINQFYDRQDAFSILKTFNRIVVINSNGTWGKSYTPSDMINMSPNKIGFYERAKRLESKTESDIEEIKEKISNIKSDLLEVNSWSLSQIIEKVGVDSVFKDDSQENKLRIFLLRNGYIDEEYHNYITYFYAGSMTYEDKNFVLSIKDQESLGFDYKLNNINTVISRLNRVEFKRPEILNYSLVDYLFKYRDYENYQEYLNLVLDQLSNESRYSVDFIDSFMDITKHKDIFIKLLCKIWDNIGQAIINESSFPAKRVKKYIRDIIIYADFDSIQSINSDKVLTEYISETNDFIKLIEKTDYQKVEKVFSQLEVKFIDIEDTLTQSRLHDYIYRNELYQININMIIQIAHKKEGCNLQDLYARNLTCIINSNNSLLWNYIDNNMQVYIDKVFLQLPENKYETQDILKMLLNRSDIDEESKKLIIDKEEIVLNDITSVDEELWSYLINNSKIDVTWNNLINYFLYAEKIDNSMISFLNSEQNCSILSETKLFKKNQFSDEVYNKISRAIIHCEGIKKNIFIKLTKSIPYVYTQIDTTNMSHTRVEDLISCNLIKLTKETYDNIREFHKDKVILLIEKNIDKFLKELTQYKIDSNDITNILHSKEINCSNKVKILRGVDINEIANTIDEINLIYEVLTNCKSGSNQINKPLFKKLYKGLTTKKLKTKLLIDQMVMLEDEDITDCLNSLGKPYSRITNKGENPTIMDSDLNRSLISKLEDNNYISSHKKDSGRIRIYTKRK